MPSYPTHLVSGVPLDDPMGRWHEGVGTSILSVFPGARTTGYQLPGVSGTLPVPIAPNEPSSIKLEMVFNAVDSGGKIVSGVEARAAALTKHINDFLVATNLGASTWVGSIQITRRITATESRIADCRIAASVTPEWTPGEDHATATIILECMSGMWRDPAFIESGAVAPNNVNTAIPTLHPSTAVIQDAMVGIVGPVTNPKVINEQGNGFQLILTVPAGQGVVVNSRLWSYGSTVALPLRWEDPQPNRGALRPVGQASARAISIIPRSGGGSVRFTGSATTSATKVVINARKAFY